MKTWRPIAGFEGLYDVSSDGEVRNARTDRVLRSRPDSDGYRLVTLWKGRPTKKHDMKVHRLVAFAFLGEPPADCPHVDHIDRNRANNVLVNLRWSTVSANLRNTAARGLLGILGVRYREDRKNPWQAYAKIDGRQKSLGMYPTPEAASAARKRKLEEMGL